MFENSESKSNSEINEATAILTNVIKFLRDIVIIFLIAFVIRSFVLMTFQISGPSMNDSYSDKEYILINRFSYLNFNTHFNEYLKNNPDPITGTIAQFLKKIPIHIGDPKRGDVIVFRPPNVNKKEYPFFVKRVIALPGDTIRFSEWKVFIKTAKSADFVQLSEPYLSLVNTNNTLLKNVEWEKSFTIPDDNYWVMGDNRIGSVDSRGCFSGICDSAGTMYFLPREAIIGKVAMSFGYFQIQSESWFSFSWKVKPRFFNTPSSAQYPELDYE